MQSSVLVLIIINGLFNVIETVFEIAADIVNVKYLLILALSKNVFNYSKKKVYIANPNPYLIPAIYAPRKKFRNPLFS